MKIILGIGTFSWHWPEETVVSINTCSSETISTQRGDILKKKTARECSESKDESVFSRKASWSSDVRKVELPTQMTWKRSVGWLRRKDTTKFSKTWKRTQTWDVRQKFRRDANNNRNHLIVSRRILSLLWILYINVWIEQLSFSLEWRRLKC